jgi:hypothetical protein
LGYLALSYYASVAMAPDRSTFWQRSFLLALGLEKNREYPGGSLKAAGLGDG